MNKVFLITFEKPGLLSGWDATKFHNSLTKAKGVTNWFHYISNSYIIIADRTASVDIVNNAVTSLLPKNTYLLILQIDNISNYNGQLPKEAWDWIQQNIQYSFPRFL